MVIELASGRTGTGRQRVFHYLCQLVNPCGPPVGSEVSMEFGFHSCRSGVQDWSNLTFPV